MEASIRASECIPEIPVQIYAIEKNPHAVVILKNKQKYIWNDKVTVVATDMREWDAPYKAHIIVSELLGMYYILCVICHMLCLLCLRFYVFLSQHTLFYSYYSAFVCFYCFLFKLYTHAHNII